MAVHGAGASAPLKRPAAHQEQELSLEVDGLRAPVGADPLAYAEPAGHSVVSMARQGAECPAAAWAKAPAAHDEHAPSSAPEPRSDVKWASPDAMRTLATRDPCSR